MFEYYSDILKTATLSKTGSIQYEFERNINCVSSPFARFVLEETVSKTIPKAVFIMF